MIQLFERPLRAPPKDTLWSPTVPLPPAHLGLRGGDGPEARERIERHLDCLRPRASAAARSDGGLEGGPARMLPL